MGKLKRGAFCTDIHFGKKANSVQHNQDCLRFIEWFCERVKQYECDYVAFLGDWNENRSAINIHTLNYSHRGAKLLNELGLPVFFVIGNHDLYYRHSREVHSIITHHEFENFTVIDDPIVVDDIEGKVLFCPYLFHEEYPTLTKYLDVPFWAGHFEFKGFIVTGHNVTMPTGPQHTDFKGPKYIVSGHFHKRQRNENVIYIGNTFPLDFGDADDNERGMMIYDHSKDNMFFVNWEECPKYTKLRLSDLVDVKNPKSLLTEQTTVKCLVDEQISFEEHNEIRQQLMDYFDIRDMLMEESPDIRTALAETDIDIDWETTELQSVDDLVIQMLQNVETTQYDSNKLIDIYKTLKVDV